MSKKVKNKTTKTTYAHCHEGNVFVFNIGNVKIHGGGSSHKYKPFHADILVDTLGTFDNEALPARTAALFPTLVSLWPIVFPLRVTDGCAPSWTKMEWEAFITDLKAIGDPKDLLVFCIGGHGRTGTILSVLVGLIHPEYGDPVKWVRDNYCEKAVESKKQIDYVQNITGIEIKEEARPFYTKSQGTLHTTKGGGYYYAKQNKEPPLYDTILPDDERYESDDWKDSSQYKGYQYRFLSRTEGTKQQSIYRIPPKDLGDKPEFSWISEFVQLGEWVDSEVFPGWEFNLQGHAYRRKNKDYNTTVVQSSEDAPPANRILKNPIWWAKNDWQEDTSWPGWLYSPTLNMWKRSTE